MFHQKRNKKQITTSSDESDIVIQMSMCHSVLDIYRWIDKYNNLKTSHHIDMIYCSCTVNFYWKQIFNKILHMHSLPLVPLDQTKSFNNYSPSFYICKIYRLSNFLSFQYCKYLKWKVCSQEKKFNLFHIT